MNQVTGKDRFSQRNYGIDLLRLVAAFYVVILHTFNQGGIIESTAAYSGQNMLSRMMLIVSYCAVNIFGIISGYVGYREPLKKISYSGYLPLWLTVVFYNLMFAGFYAVIDPGSVTRNTLVGSFFPLLTNLFWYFSAYTFVYFLAPFLNRILYYSSEKELKLLLFLICCAAVPLEYISQPFEIENGYSAFWLVLLYLVGGILKKTGFASSVPAYMLFLAIVVIDTLFFFLGLKWSKLTFSLFSISFEIHFSYITPVYLAAAMLHVLLFSKLKFPVFMQKIIRFSAPAAFSVYIANTNPLFWKKFMFQHFASWGTSSPAGIFFRTTLFSLGFVFVVVNIDFFRQQLFQILGVQNWAKKLSGSFRTENKAKL